MDYGLPKSPNLQESLQLNETLNGVLEENEENEEHKGNGSPSSADNYSVIGGDAPGAPRVVTTLSPTVARQFSQVMLDLALDLSRDAENAAAMASLGVCNGAIMMIDKDAKFNPRDDRISYSVEVMWNVLEEFLERVKNANTNDADVKQVLQYSYGVMDFELSI
ncbi:MAG: hypothetical protein ACK55I_42120, partial [bacterium]